MKTDDEIALELSVLRKEGLDAIIDIQKLIDNGALVDPDIKTIAKTLNEKVQNFLYLHSASRTLH